VVTERAAIGERLAEVRQRVADAARRSGRDAAAVRIMAVTKTQPREVVEQAIAAGVTLLGENRVQEAQAKFAGLAGAWELHLIGHLQRNKAAEAARLFSCVQSIDRVETAEALDRRSAALGRRVDVLIEYNTSGEESKSGVRSREELAACIEGVRRLPSLRVRGLMTVGPLGADPEATRRAFRLLAGMLDEARRAYPDAGLDTLSMGMSGDFEMAVEEGSTLLRLGTVLFGPRGQ
jgi:pyridoxal phosphate enzyme (YggS family)